MNQLTSPKETPVSSGLRTPSSVETCTFQSCHQPAVILLTQKIGKRQKTYCCGLHVPTWAKTGQPSAFARRFGAESHTVEKLPCAY